MKKNDTPFDVESVLKFFEETTGAKFIDTNTGKPALELVAENKEEGEKSDYDLWLEQQSDEVKEEHAMGAI